MNKQIKVSFRFTLLATIGLGIIYPLLVAGVGVIMPQITPPPFPEHPLQSEDLFQARPSLSGGPYSGASNLSLTNPALWKQVEDRVKELSKYPPKGVLIPRDLLFASASGYDPDISVEGALHQIPRIALVHKIDEDLIRQLVKKHTKQKLMGFVGTIRVNVVELNEDLKKLIANVTPPAERGMFHIAR